MQLAALKELRRQRHVRALNAPLAVREPPPIPRACCRFAAPSLFAITAGCTQDFGVFEPSGGSGGSGNQGGGGPG